MRRNQLVILCLLTLLGGVSAHAQGFPAYSPTKEYIYFLGQIVAIENSTNGTQSQAVGRSGGTVVHPETAAPAAQQPAPAPASNSGSASPPPMPAPMPPLPKPAPHIDRTQLTQQYPPGILPPRTSAAPSSTSSPH